ncbi:hypothetical protein [Planctopirus hydrillae]|uniref:Glycosyl hydrolases family 2 sugar binding domain-containing protein n=1 Tax=Planctopirus hydrillae TaxID=1841610 RepID=A0A1C3E7R4_9PLAN|nr:hypothetical protein [Planctopirus hydrillae]ODA29282.1 hypothetical protein A6X21_09290 [Planctopirus hydrillae]
MVTEVSAARLQRSILMLACCCLLQNHLHVFAQESGITTTDAVIHLRDLTSRREVEIKSRQEAFRTVVQGGVINLLPLLQQIDKLLVSETPVRDRMGDDTASVQIQWLKSAGDEILTNALRQGIKFSVDDPASVAGTVVGFMLDSNRSADARKIAQEWCELIQPDSTRQLLKGRFSDPCFSELATELALEEASHLEKEGKVTQATELLLDAWNSNTNPEAIQTLAKRLGEYGHPQKTHQKLGMITQWSVLGPFPQDGSMGLSSRQQPIESPSLGQKYPVGDRGEISWQNAFQKDGENFLDIKKTCGDVDDSVAWLHAVIEVPREAIPADQKTLPATILAGADDTIEVWLNEKKVIDASWFFQRPRLDKHRAFVELSPGTNELILRVCEAKKPPGPPAGGPQRWQVGLRVVGRDGKPLSFPLPQAR